MRGKGFTGSRSPGEEKWVESEKALVRPRPSDVLEFRVSELGKQTPGEEVAEVIWSGGRNSDGAIWERESHTRNHHQLSSLSF